MVSLYAIGWQQNLSHKLTVYEKNGKGCNLNEVLICSKTSYNTAYVSTVQERTYRQIKRVEQQTHHNKPITNGTHERVFHIRYGLKS